MSKPTVVAVILTGEEIVAAAMLDPMGFIERKRVALDRAARETAVADNRFAVSHGSEWGLFLPGDKDTTTIRATYGAEPAELLDAAIEQAGEHAVVVWKVIETIPRGQG